MRILLLLAAALLAPPVAADVIVVPLDQPTIQAAVDAAQAGDAIEILAGIYTEEVTLTAKTDLTLRGTGKAVLRTGLQGLALDMEDCLGIRVEKLRFDGPGTGIQDIDGVNLEVAFCRFDDLETGVSSFGSLGAAIVRDSFFTNIRRNAVELQPDDGGLANVLRNRVRGAEQGIAIFGGRANVQGNDIRRVARSGILLSSLQFNAVQDSRVRKNRIADCGRFGIDCEIVQLQVKTLIISQNQIKKAGLAGIFVQSGQNTLLEDNIVRSTGVKGLHIEFAQTAAALLGNDVRKVRGDAIHVGVGVDLAYAIADNLIVAAGHDGIVVDADGSNLTGNQVTGSDRFGVDLGGEDGTLSANVLTGSGEADLHQDNPGSNTIADDNVFETEDP